MAKQPFRMIVVDTLGKMLASGETMFGWCRRCSAKYRPALGPRNPRCSFDIDLAALIAARGPDHPIVGMAPVACPYCGSRETEIRISGKQKVPDRPRAVRTSVSPP